MTKRDFQEIISENKVIFHALVLEDATVTCVSNHSAIEIVWKGHHGSNTVVRTLRGKTTDLKIKEIFAKYETWLNQTLNQ